MHCMWRFDFLHGLHWAYIEVIINSYLHSPRQLFKGHGAHHQILAPPYLWWSHRGHNRHWRLIHALVSNIVEYTLNPKPILEDSENPFNNFATENAFRWKTLHFVDFCLPCANWGDILHLDKEIKTQLRWHTRHSLCSIYLLSWYEIKSVVNMHSLLCSYKNCNVMWYFPAGPTRGSSRPNAFSCMQVSLADPPTPQEHIRSLDQIHMWYILWQCTLPILKKGLAYWWVHMQEYMGSVNRLDGIIIRDT